MNRKVLIVFIFIMIGIIAFVLILKSGKINNRLIVNESSMENTNVEFELNSLNENEYDIYVDGQYIVTTDSTMLDIYKDNPYYNPSF